MDVFNTIGDAFKSIGGGGFLKNITGGEFISSGAELLSLGDTLGDTLNSIGDTLDPFKKLLDEITDVFNKAFDPVKKTLEKIPQEILDKLTEVLDPIKETLEKIPQEIEDNANKLFHDLVDVLEKYVEQIEKRFTKIFDLIQKFIKVFFQFLTFMRDFALYLGNAFYCAGFYIKNLFSICILYYIFRLFVLIVYGITTFFFWLFGIQWVEKWISDGLSSLNQIFLKITTAFGTPINIEEAFYPPECYDCEFSFGNFPKFNVDFNINDLLGDLGGFF